MTQPSSPLHEHYNYTVAEHSAANYLNIFCIQKLFLAASSCATLTHYIKAKRGKNPSTFSPGCSIMAFQSRKSQMAVGKRGVLWRQQLRVHARPEKDILGYTNPKGGQGFPKVGGDYNLIFITVVCVCEVAVFGSRRTATVTCCWPKSHDHGRCKHSVEIKIIINSQKAICCKSKCTSVPHLFTHSPSFFFFVFVIPGIILHDTAGLCTGSIIIRWSINL